MNGVIALLDPVADTDPNDLALAYFARNSVVAPGKRTSAAR